nr:SHOCT domain-containing protein [Methylocapsa acidiphila]
MQDLSPEGRKIVEEAARRHGVSAEAAATLLRALAHGNGLQAQFNHPDLGGMGQWSQGGMIMIGDMFNQGLKARIDQLCRELAELLRGQPLFAAPASSQSQAQGGVSLFVSGASSGAWWPAELGVPASTGAQNDLRYAYFPARRRLAIQHGGELRVYDSGDHDIAGFSQQQSGDQSLTFTSQHGRVRVADLPVVTPGAPSNQAEAFYAHPDAGKSEQPSGAEAPRPPPTPLRASGEDIFTMIERLADLRQKNILTEEEFTQKKAELLGRL